MVVTRLHHYFGSNYKFNENAFKKISKYKDIQSVYLL